MRAHSFNTQPSGVGDLSWMLATQYSWLLLYTTGAVWYAEIELTLRAANKHREVTVRQWVPADAVRLPTAEELEHWRSQSAE
ncbi:hypothetical protein ACFYXQ_15995 [Nocardia jiangxiensis]|uniref:Uncharacterized protein n=1 Tax=Nocardia jiangxiensis TaxID=282685 RepID=A0ABW6RZ20_9NOCA